MDGATLLLVVQWAVDPAQIERIGTGPGRGGSSSWNESCSVHVWFGRPGVDDCRPNSSPCRPDSFLWNGPAGLARLAEVGRVGRFCSGLSSGRV